MATLKWRIRAWKGSFPTILRRNNPSSAFISDSGLQNSKERNSHGNLVFHHICALSGPPEQMHTQPWLPSYSTWSPNTTHQDNAGCLPSLPLAQLWLLIHTPRGSSQGWKLPRPEPGAHFPVLRAELSSSPTQDRQQCIVLWCHLSHQGQPWRGHPCVCLVGPSHRRDLLDKGTVCA